ncbi:YciI family protein [Streptomyces sp. NPDC002680]|uniref:YciI family protein n=1 Tax=Streptomyces sp. NPDC002680 TaxID=3364659 RepID=UPI0036C6BE59
MKHFAVTLTFVKGAPGPGVGKAQGAWLTKLYEQNTLTLSGGFADGGGDMAVLRGDTLEAVQDLYRDSPIVRDGGAAFVVREWNIVFGVVQG